jgi:ZIP family zinc transporter
MIGKPVHRGEEQGISLGSLLGSVVYTAGDWGISQLGGHHRTKIESEHAVGAEAGIALGTVLDGVPESFVTGITLSAEGSASLAFIAAAFITNLPEAIASTAGLKRRWSAVDVYAGWTTTVALCALIAALGYAAAQAYSGYSGAALKPSLPEPS